MIGSPFFFTEERRDQIIPTPTILNVTPTAFETNTTTHAVAFPASVPAGSLLLLLWTNDGTATVTTPAGFTQQYNVSGTGRSCAYKKIAVGNEGGTTVNVQTSATEAGSAQMYNITDWIGALTGVVGTTLTSPNSGTSRSAPSLTSGFGNMDTLWIVTAHASATQTVTALPASFTDLTTTGASGTTSGQTYSGRRFLKVPNLTPGSFTISSSSTVVFARSTIAVRGVL